ncbi:MAG: FAD-dependent oxidoreductase [Pseudomonadota bacterium]
MRSTARVVVIGGGIAGCSTLYHLTREGWRDVVLLERDELTSGTTWHSAAQVTNFGMTQTMVGLKAHSIRLYKELAEDPDYPINYHHGDGGVRLAGTEAQLDGYRHFQSLAKGMGVHFEIIDAEELCRRHPLLTPDGVIGALWDPFDGDIDPAQLCQALARRARKAGAEIHRHTPVTGLTQRDGGWSVHTDKGDIDAEHIVNAGGYRCNEIGAMMGVTLPVCSMEHQYFLTEPIAAIAEREERLPLVRSPLEDFYARQEKQGLLVGFYEQDCRTWGLGGIDPNFTNALCPDDPERVTPTLERVFERMPCLTETGIHTIVNGPITYTPDGAPLIGPIPGRRNAWACTGLRIGLGEGGGQGWMLSQMIVRGEAEYDNWGNDPRRFGAYATEEYTAVKAIEDYQNEFHFHMPHEQRPAGRPARVTPLTPVLEGLGAEFGEINGWERALVYSPPGLEETPGFRWPASHDLVGQEVERVRRGVGIAEVNGFNRIELLGEGVVDWLDGLICGRVPRKTGRVGLGYFLTAKGHVAGEATLAVLGQDRVWFGSAAAAEIHDRDWLTAHLPADGSISLKPLTETHTILVVAGPKARALLAEVAPRTDWSPTAFPWLSVRTVSIGSVEAVAMSVSFSGEAAWELHIPVAQSLAAWRALMRAGEAFGIAPFGAHAVESMRIEKGYRHWKADLITEYDPFEAGLDRFVSLDKAPSYPGKDALLARRNQAPRKQFVSLRLATDQAPAHGGASVLAGDRVVGTVTSAAWGFRTSENLAMAYIDADVSQGSALSIEVLGDAVPAEIVPPCRYDPENARVKA